jgi:hypothetical protein
VGCQRPKRSTDFSLLSLGRCGAKEPERISIEEHFHLSSKLQRIWYRSGE